MVKHYNPSIAAQARRLLGTKGDNLSSEIFDAIIPVLQLAPIQNIANADSRDTTGETTLYTAPSDKNFYLCNLTFNNVSNAACDDTYIYVTATINGNTRTIAQFNKATLTAFIQSTQYVFNPPILISPGGIIKFGTAFTVGASTTVAIVSGYVLEAPATT